MVRHALVNDLPLGRSVDEALRVLDALQFHEQHGDVCPANWHEGEEAMKPTAEGVAKYLAKRVPVGARVVGLGDLGLRRYRNGSAF